MNRLKTIFNFIFPQACVCCRELTHSNASLCQACHAALPNIENACPQCSIPQRSPGLCPRCFYHPPLYQRMICVYQYRDPLPTFIQQLKFSSRLIYARVLADLLIPKLKTHIENNGLPDCLIPVPLHTKRIKERGFNQTLEIAKHLSRHFSLQCLPFAVKRNKATLPQTLTRGIARKKNVENAFMVITPLPKHVAIIEDVVTTGATIHALCQCLLKSGVEKIEVWCCARTISG